MQQILLIMLIIAAIVMIALILMQQGKGATAGASFGAGASQTVFGSAGAASFLVKMTAFCAALFFIICLVLGRMAANENKLQVPVTPKQTQQTSLPASTSQTAPVAAQKVEPANKVAAADTSVAPQQKKTVVASAEHTAPVVEKK